MFRRLPLVLALTSCGGARTDPHTPIARHEPARAAVAQPPPPPVPAVDSIKPEPKPEKKDPLEASRPGATASGLDVAELTGAPANAALKGSVLVWVDARLFLAPKDDAVSFQLATLDNRKDHVGEAVPMRVVSTKGAFVEIESPFTDELQNTVEDCAWYGVGTQHDIGRWRVFVKRTDLAPVVSKKHTATFADGSSLTIEPGLPVLPLADTKTLVDLKSAWVPVQLPAAVIGYAYSTSPPPKTPKEADQPAHAPKYKLHASKLRIAGTEVPLRGIFAPLAERIETKGDVVAFPIDDTCAKATVVAAAADVQPYERSSGGDSMGGIGFGYGEVMGVERWYVPKGTRLVAENGTAYATTRIDISVPAPDPKDATVCLARSLRASSRYLFAPGLQKVASQDIRVCVPARAIKHEKAKPFMGGGGGGGVGGLGGLPSKRK